MKNEPNGTRQRRIEMTDATFAKLDFLEEISERKKPAVLRRLIEMAAERVRSAGDDSARRETLQALGLD